MRYFLLFSLLMGSISQMLAQPFVQTSKAHGCYHYRNQLPPLNLAANSGAIQADNARSDTFDILHYDIYLDVTNASTRTITAATTVRFAARMNNLDKLLLDLQGLTVDSIWNSHGQLTYRQDSALLKIDLPEPMHIGDTAEVHVAYSGMPFNFPNGFGGFYFENGYIYNLSIGIPTYPHNFGRVWFPCFDNFQERSTYGIDIITSDQVTAAFSGDLIEKENIDNNKIRWRFENNIPLPTYLVSMAAARYEAIEWMHDGLFREIPVKILAKSQDLTLARSAFSTLDDAIFTFENWYGEMPWSSVGFTMATKGAMENPGNTIYPDATVRNSNSSDPKPLMSHELAHQWWGNIVNPKTSMDMWIKEGNAEYGSHIFYEYLKGRETFEKIVADNILEVLKTAHVDDQAFLPLSPMPRSHTYGNHTYYKGAAMLHNMRTYLGDSLFEIGQRSVLNNYYLQPMDAYEYRDQLTQATGVDMSDFFDDWIFAPGYSDFQVDSMQIADNGNTYEVTVFVKQKVRAAPDFYDNVPLHFTFIDEQLEEHIFRQSVSGERITATFSLPFAPRHVFLNTHQELNLAQLNDTKIISEPGTVNFRNTGFQVQVTQVVEPGFLHVEHHWTAPDPIANTDLNIRMSNSHFWSVKGEMPDGFEAKVNLLTYNGNAASGFIDRDLLEFTEDSLKLVYRRHPGEDWYEYEHYLKIPLGPSDKKGFIRIEKLKLGDYAFANGYFPRVANAEVPDQSPSVKIFPNPVQSRVLIYGKVPDFANVPVQTILTGAAGNILQTKTVRTRNGEFSAEFNMTAFSPGLYFVRTQYEGRLISVEKLVVH